MARPRITEETRREIARLSEEGLSIHAIAKIPGMPVRSTITNYVSKRCGRLGPPKIPEDVQREIIRLYRAGMSMNAMAKLPGMPARSSIRKYISLHEERAEIEAQAAAARTDELTAEPIGSCPVSGARLYLVRDEDHEHIVPEAIVKQAADRKWRVAA
jgi:transposase-like protein